MAAQEILHHSRSCVHQLQMHLILVTKYRRKILTDSALLTIEHQLRVRAKSLDADIIEFNGEADHVHLLVRYPPTMSVAAIVQALKSHTAYHAMRHHPELQQPAWKRNKLWSPGYFVTSVGGAPIEVLNQCIRQKKGLTRRLRLRAIHVGS